MPGDDVVAVAFPIEGLPSIPDESLDAYLDAATRCMARHGVRRTTVADIAKELGVSRMTVYRHVGTPDNVLHLLFARDMNRLLEEIPTLLRNTEGAELVVSLATALVEWVESHPVGHKVLTDEPDVVGQLLGGAMVGQALELGIEVLTYLLQEAMDEGRLGQQDARVLASWLVRLTFSVVVVPPPRDRAEYLATVVRSMFERADGDPQAR